MADLEVLEFRAMGSPARIVLDGGPAGLSAQIRDFVWFLERQWSRFLTTSEVSALNHSSGSVTLVSPETFTLFSRAVQAQDLTDGLFNPLMLDQLEHHGYRQSWNMGLPEAASGPFQPATDEPIVLYPDIGAVRLPAGCRFDPGGIGKGLAIDLAVERCVASGATTASVEIGGDLRVYGEPWYGPHWRIGVADPFDPSVDVAHFTPTEGAVTTSSVMKRRWADGDRELHHLLDPQTGCPATTDIVAVTTCSSAAWFAEVAAKSAIVAGVDRAVAVLEALGTPGVVIAGNGDIATVAVESSLTELKQEVLL